MLFGLLAFSWPDLSVRIFLAIFGAYAIVDGVLSMVHALAGLAAGQRSWPALLEGLVGVAVGIAVFFWPGLTAVALLIFIAIRALATGILGMFTTVLWRKEMEQGWLQFLGGLVSAIFGLYLMLRPRDGALALLWLIATYAVAVGIVQVALAFVLRRRERQAGSFESA